MKRSALLLALLGTLFLTGCPDPPSPGTSSGDKALMEIYQKGEALYLAGEYKLALKRFMYCRTAEPNHKMRDMFDYRIGLCKMTLREYSRAREIFDELLKTTKKTELKGLLYVNKGHCYYGQRRFPAAATCYELALREYSQYLKVDAIMYRMSECYRHMEQYRVAEEKELAVLRAFPKSQFAEILRKDVENNRNVASQPPTGLRGWVVQCCLARKEKSAQKVFDILKTQGLQPTIRLVDYGDVRVRQVYLGPFATKERANDFKSVARQAGISDAFLKQW